MPSFFQIVAHTPLWVWGVLAYLVVDGLSGLRPSTLSPWRLLILPMVGIGLSLVGLGQTPRSDIAYIAWAAALLGALPLGYLIGRRRAVRRLADGRLEMAGGWFGLLFGLAIFSVRYALGVLFALQPSLKAEPLWIALSNGIGGMVAGIGLGWLAGVLLRLYVFRDRRTILGLSAALLLIAGDARDGWAQQRFDFKVREDLFAGMDGDSAAFERAMKLIEETLAASPDHAEALVWRGDGRLFLAGQAFQRGAVAEGQALSAEALADMDRAVALAPTNIAVRVPRAAGLLPYAKGLRRYDPSAADRLIATAVGDLEFVVAASTPWWDRMKEHGRGELLGGLADGWLALGVTAKANTYLDRMSSELPGTLYARNAALRRADPMAKVPLTCLGCH